MRLFCDDFVECHEDQVKCSNEHRCIYARLVCDDDNDCGDWSDEQNCGEGYFTYSPIILLYTDELIDEKNVPTKIQKR